MESTDLIAITADIVSSHVNNNKVASAELPPLIASVYEALVKTTTPAAPEAVKQEPAVPIRSSVKHDYLISLESGKKVKMLKRYLRTQYNMTPEEYRAKWSLPRDYPMVAPAYAATRKAIAEKIGLGRKKVTEAVEAVEKPLTKAAKKVGIVAAKAAAAAHLTGEAKPAAKRGRPAKVKVETLVEA